MTSISRRSFLAVAAASGAAALSNTVSPVFQKNLKIILLELKALPNTQHCRSRFLTLA